MNPYNPLGLGDSMAEDDIYNSKKTNSVAKTLEGTVYNERDAFSKTNQNRTFGFDLKDSTGKRYTLVVQESPSKSYEQLTKEIRNGDQISVNKVKEVKNPTNGQTFYYITESDRIEIVRRGEK